MKARAVRFMRGFIKKIIPDRWRPIPYLNAKTYKISNNVVYMGPFRSMKYIDRAHCSSLLPKILGIYEMELHSIVEEACNLPIERIIDIGSAEGYYAVGFALRCPGIPMIAFETDSAARQSAKDLIQLNGVEGQVEVRGHCGLADLSELTGDKAAIVICDCEGDEAVLLDPSQVAGLANSYLLVELHEFIVPGVTELLRQRFAATHAIEVIWQRDRRREDFPLSDWYIRRMQNLDLAGVMSEGRPIRMHWMWMKPFAAT